MDDFREWLSDNLRYILLGLAIILVLVIAFFAVRLVTEHLSDDNQDINLVPETKTELVTETATTEPATEATDPLQTENSAILETVQNYYNAVASKDMETLQSLCESLDEASQQSILASPIESYNNITIYFKDGLTAGSYNVYPYYEAKMPNIDQLVPSLGNIYLDTREDGTLYVVDYKNHEEVAEFMKNAKDEQDVQDLIARVNNDYNAVKASNTQLQEVIDKYQQPETEIDIPDASTVDVDINQSVTVTGNLNVRSDSRADADLLGYLAPGMTVTRIQELDNGWSKVRFDDGAGTIVEGYVLSEYLEVQ